MHKTVLWLEDDPSWADLENESSFQKKLSEILGQHNSQLIVFTNIADLGQYLIDNKNKISESNTVILFDVMIPGQRVVQSHKELGGDDRLHDARQGYQAGILFYALNILTGFTPSLPSLFFTSINDHNALERALSQFSKRRKEKWAVLVKELPPAVGNLQAIEDQLIKWDFLS